MLAIFLFATREVWMFICGSLAWIVTQKRISYNHSLRAYLMRDLEKDALRQSGKVGSRFSWILPQEQQTIFILAAPVSTQICFNCSKCATAWNELLKLPTFKEPLRDILHFAKVRSTNSILRVPQNKTGHYQFIKYICMTNKNYIYINVYKVISSEFRWTEFLVSNNNKFIEIK